MKKLIAYGVIHGKGDQIIRSQLSNKVVEEIRLRSKLDCAKRRSNRQASK